MEGGDPASDRGDAKRKASETRALEDGTGSRTPTLYKIKTRLGQAQWLDGCRLYVSRIPHADDKTDNLYNGVSMWLSANYLIHA